MIKPGEPWPFDLTRPSEPGEETYGRDDDPSCMPARLRDLTGKQQTMIRAYVAGRTMARAVYMYLPPAEATRIMELVEALCKREIDALIAPYDPDMLRRVDAEEERERTESAVRAAASSEAAKVEAAAARRERTAGALTTHRPTEPEVRFVEHAPPRLRKSLGFIVRCGFQVFDGCGFQVFDGRVFDSYEAAYQYAEALYGNVRMYFDIVERSPI